MNKAAVEPCCHHLNAYDAAYLELARRERIPLATLDVHLRKTCPEAGVALFEYNRDK